MGKHIIIYALISLMLFACHNSEERENASQNIGIDSSLREALKYFKLDSIECANTANDYMRVNGLFNAFCPSDTISDIPISRRKKYPFDTLITTTKDTLIYSFKVSSECCYKFYGRYSLNADTLVVMYGNNCNPCDCYCDYILTYKIPRKMKFKHIVIKYDKYHEVK